MSNNQNQQIIETGSFDQEIGSTLKKNQQYQDYMKTKNENARSSYPSNSSAMVVPELNLSPRDEFDEVDP